MARTKQISNQQRFDICTLRNKGLTLSQIAQKVGVSKKGVFTTLDRTQNTGTILDRSRSGRPKKTTDAEDKLILAIRKENRRLTAGDIANEINLGRSSKISVTTVKQRLSTLKNEDKTEEPVLRTVNKEKRLKWAQEYASWTAEQWNNVLWTGQFKFEIARSKDECLVKHASVNLAVWGCFAGNRIGALKKLRKGGYHSILKNTAIPCGKRLCSDNFMFQEDIDPKLDSPLCQDYLKSLEVENVCQRMIWPPQSSDLSPIDFLWDELDHQFRHCAPTSKSNLWSTLQEAWGSIPEETLQKLVERMPKICQLVIEAEGGYIDDSTV